MERLYDELSMSLAAPVPRRESLWRMGAVIAGMVLNPWGLGTAWAGQDPCRAYCRCSNKAQQNQCLAACRACNKETSRLGGSCGSYVCCSTATCDGVCSDLASDPNCGACGNNCRDIGETCCGNYCADLANDFDNCGACGARCADPAPYEDGACVLGECVYLCVEGAIDCDGTCIPVHSDPNNCGACGNVCPASAPYCNQALCSACPTGLVDCDGTCMYLGSDPDNCGACGNACPAEAPFCTNGTCTVAYCNGADLYWDNMNCGGCGIVCPEQTACAWGFCEGLTIN